MAEVICTRNIYCGSRAIIYRSLFAYLDGSVIHQLCGRVSAEGFAEAGRIWNCPIQGHRKQTGKTQNSHDLKLISNVLRLALLRLSNGPGPKSQEVAHKLESCSTKLHGIHMAYIWHTYGIQMAYLWHQSIRSGLIDSLGISNLLAISRPCDSKFGLEGPKRRDELRAGHEESTPQPKQSESEMTS